MNLLKNALTQKSKPKWRKELTSGDVFLQDPKPSDLVIAIMGATGAGKSTFINTLLGEQVAPVGHTLRSHTAFVQAYTYNDPQFPKNRIVMVDTPGFDDTSLSDREILRRIGVWLAQSYDARMKMAGVIYLHDISAKRWQGSTARNFEVFERLCGQAAARKVVLVTTMWDQLVSKAVGEKREEELKMQYWKGMIENGSAVHRGSLEQMSAQDTVDFLLAKEATYPLQIQKELGEVNKTLQDTEAVRHLSEALEALLKTREESAPLLREGTGDPKLPQRALENDSKSVSIRTIYRTGTRFNDYESPVWCSQPAGGLGTSILGRSVALSQPQDPQSQHLLLQQRIEGVYNAWNSASPQCRFQHAFYNFVDPTKVAQYQRPQNISNELWEKARRENPDPSCFVPVFATGFDDLRLRVDAQSAQSEKLKQRLTDVKKRLDVLSERHALSNVSRLKRATAQQVQLTQRLLAFTQHLHLLIPAIRSSAIRPEEEQLRGRLEEIEEELRRGRLAGKLNELWALIGAVGATSEKGRNGDGSTDIEGTAGGAGSSYDGATEDAKGFGFHIVEAWEW
ncbi:hypothetical protein H0H93_012906 [Arthromyces matolae]|nr:hypothetical protein H0H93_012906 [Arthromyces matolae]